MKLIVGSSAKSISKIAFIWKKDNSPSQTGLESQEYDFKISILLESFYV